MFTVKQATASNTGMQRTALCARKIGAFLEVRIGSTPVPIYRCAAADAQTVGRAGSVRWFQKKRLIGHRGSCLGGRLVRSRGACLGCWRSCFGGRLVRTHGACLRCWRACLRCWRACRGGRRIHARGIMPAVRGSCLRCWRACLAGRLIRTHSACLGCWRSCLGDRPGLMLRRMPGVLTRMPRRRAVGRDRAACPAQPGIAADRFTREIVRFLM